MTTEIFIRPARASDAERLGRIGLSAWKKGIGPYVSAAAHASIDEQIFEVFVRTHHERILIAELSGEIRGFAGRECGGNVITDLWIDPAVEGRGVGSRLLQAIEQVIAGLGYRSAFIEVLTANRRAFHLYQRHGYEINWQEIRRDGILGVELHKTCFSKTLG